MAWLARLDASARRRSPVIHYPYLALKWLFVALGVYGAFGLAYMELSERRVGLGLGLSTAIVFAIIRGVHGAFTESSGTQPPARSG